MLANEAANAEKRRITQSREYQQSAEKQASNPVAPQLSMEHIDILLKGSESTFCNRCAFTVPFLNATEYGLNEQQREAVLNAFSYYISLIKVRKNV